MYKDFSRARSTVRKLHCRISGALRPENELGARSQTFVNSLAEIVTNSDERLRDEPKESLFSRLKAERKGNFVKPFLSNCILKLHCIQAAPALLCSELHKPFSQVGIVLLQITNHVRLFFQDFV